MVRGWTPVGARFSGPIQTCPRSTHSPIWMIPALFVGGSTRLTHKPANLPHLTANSCPYVAIHSTGYNCYKTWIMRRNIIVRLYGLENNLLDVQLDISWHFTGAISFFSFSCFLHSNQLSKLPICNSSHSIATPYICNKTDSRLIQNIFPTVHSIILFFPSNVIMFCVQVKLVRS